MTQLAPARLEPAEGMAVKTRNEVTRWDDEPEVVERGIPIQPHRAGTISLLGVVGMIFPILGIAAWVMGSHDLDLMRQGRMDQSGKAETRFGVTLGILSTILMVIGLLVLIAALAGFVRFVSSHPRPNADREPVSSDRAKRNPEKPLTDKQKAAATDAIKALGKIEAAVQVGVNFQHYGQLVIDAKAVVNEAKRTLPAGQMLTNLTEAMDAYKDASTVWNFKIRWDLALGKKLGHGEIIERYKLPLNENDEANTEIAMQLIWAVGAQKLAAARALQEQSGLQPGSSKT
jgi:hypothetical protein